MTNGWQCRQFTPGVMCPHRGREWGIERRSETFSEFVDLTVYLSCAFLEMCLEVTLVRGLIVQSPHPPIHLLSYTCSTPLILLFLLTPLISRPSVSGPHVLHLSPGPCPLPVCLDHTKWHFLSELWLYLDCWYSMFMYVFMPGFWLPRQRRAIWAYLSTLHISNSVRSRDPWRPVTSKVTAWPAPFLQACEIRGVRRKRRSEWPLPQLEYQCLFHNIIFDYPEGSWTCSTESFANMLNTCL